MQLVQFNFEQIIAKNRSSGKSNSYHCRQRTV